MTSTINMEALIAPLRTWQAEAEAHLQALVEISSHTMDRAGCQAMVEALLRLYDLPGLRAERRCDPAGRFGDHLVFYGAAADPKNGPPPPFTLLIGHLDTVFARSTFSGYRVSEEDRVRLARGPGVHDMKGGLVVIGLALRALAAAGLLGLVPLRGVVVADEEVGSPSSQPLTREVAQGAACALGFESGRAGDAIITRRKGVGSMVATATGKTAHAGNLHHEGHNAIWALCRFVDRAQGLTDYGRGITVNVGRIEGGQGRNIVPDRAEALLDFRFVEQTDATEVAAALRQAAAQAPLPGTTVTLSGGATRAPLVKTAASAQLYERYAQCQRQAGLGACEAPLLGGGSDASTVAPLGVPAIDGLAARGKGFHTLDEQIDLSTLLPKAEALLRFLVSTLPESGGAPTPPSRS